MTKKINLNSSWIIACFLISHIGLMAEEDVYVFKNDDVVFQEKTTSIDSVALDAGKTKLTFYKNQTETYTAAIANVDSISLMPPAKPIADVLNVIFHADGTASDVSPMKNTIDWVEGYKTMTYYNESLGRHVARFDNTPGNNAYLGYYKVNFENNTAFRNALSDGHTLEVLFTYNDNLPINKEVKPFSSMQAGGTGFLLSNNPAGNDNNINFISHLGGDWHYSYGKARPIKGTYYHVVGVWDKENKESRIYVNGELKDTKANSGSLQFAASGSNWFCIGGDATPATTIAAEAAWRGDIAIARVYNNPLTTNEVQELWKAVKDKVVNTPFSVNNIIFLPKATVKIGSSFTILADGFQNGDKVRFTSTADEIKVFDFDAVYTQSEKALRIKIGEDFEPGEYKMFVVRGEDAVPLGTTTLTIGDTVERIKITAHRGYWKSGVPQNSIAGFKAAYELGVYNSESDFWLTKDNVIVCSHDQTIQGKDIPTSNYYGDLESIKLANGEALPVFQDYLDVMNSDEYKDADMKLLIELKPNNNNLADAIVEAVATAGLEDKVEYIAFSYALCQYTASVVPAGTLVGYNNGDVLPNNFATGINWMNYEKGKIRSNPSWVKEAHDKGLFVSVWTIVNSVDEFMEFVTRGVDCISTDYPHIMQRLLNLLYGDDNDDEGNTPQKPVANLLDVVFNANGTATDISPMNNIVEVIAPNSTLDTYFNETYGCYVAKLDNAWGTGSLGSTPNYCKIDYKENEAFKNALADGYTLETLFKAVYTPPIANEEAKWFSAHEAGGTGFMICKIDMNGRRNELTFLPNVSPQPANSWKWATSGVVPEPEVFYHVVGVWNKDKGEAYIYVNGELKNTVAAVGNFNFPPNVNAQWFGIGCDAGPNGGQFGGKWEIVSARIYDEPLTQKEVSALWSQVKKMQENAKSEMVTDVEFYSGIAVLKGSSYAVAGKGFEAGDNIRFQSIKDEANVVVLGAESVDEAGIKVTIPAGFITDQYRLLLVRGEQIQDLGLASIVVVTEFPKPAKIIAHRGYWDVAGSAQNSLESIRKAQEIEVYGAEIDIWITTDGYLMLNHDESFGGVSIQNSTYAQVKNLTLSNGEKMPQLQDCLELLKTNKQTKLIIEFKTHSTQARNMAVVQAAMAAVAAEGLQDCVEYIAFDLETCKEVVRIDPTAKSSYLKGGMAPATLKDFGITGIDYHQAEFRNNPQWIQEAKDLGMDVNVWTVNTISDMAFMTNLGVQFITTDKPVDALKIREYYTENQK